jgi:hypothetical protein
VFRHEVVHIDTAAAVTREAVSRLSQAALDPAEFFCEVSARVRGVVPYDASGWMTLDPDTLLPGGALETEKPGELVRTLWRNELSVPDVHKLAVLARRPSPVASLSQLSAAAAADSRRLQLIHRPRGIGDELRVCCAPATPPSAKRASAMVPSWTVTAAATDARANSYDSRSRNLR